MTILLVRHARAGRRDRWRGDDRLRPLSKRGQLQASALPRLLRKYSGDLGPAPRVLSSPWVRCLQTVEPLALALGLSIEPEDALGEGMGDKAAEALADWMRHGPTVLCTHGDVVQRILAELAVRGTTVDDAPLAAKGSVWVLTGADGAVDSARYLPPPG